MSGDNGNNKENEISKNHIYYRIAGQLAILFLLFRHIFRVNVAMREKLPNHPELQIFHDLAPRYATVCNLIIQITYASLALACDVSEVLKQESIVPKMLRKFRYSLFSGLLYPIGMGIAVIFWPHYIYDRELVLPKKVDIVMSFSDNFAYHGLVTIYAFYELVFMPRHSLMNEKPFRYVVWFNIMYILVFYYTRYDLGIWPYEVFTVLEESLPFYLLLACPFFLSTFFYSTRQWTQDAIWKYRESI